MRVRRVLMVAVTLLSVAAMVTSVYAFKVKEKKSTLDDLAFAVPEMWIGVDPETDHGLVRAMAAPETMDSYDLLVTLENAPWVIQLDRNTGMPSSLEGRGIPWIPGTGGGNTLTGADLGLEAAIAGKDVPLSVVEGRAREFMELYRGLFGADPEDLVLLPGSGPVLDYLYFLNFQLHYHGIPVDHSLVMFRLNHGNLIQVGQEYVSPAIFRLDPDPSITLETAWENLGAYLGGIGESSGDEILEPGRLKIIPVSSLDVIEGLPIEPGEGIEYRLVYTLAFRRPGVTGTWAATVDAHTGEILRFADTNRYGEAHGGAYAGDRPVPEED